MRAGPPPRSGLHDGMARSKRARMAELDTMDNVVDGRHCPTDWFEGSFGPDRMVVLEVGCGHGEHTLALARTRPDQGILGVDRNGARLWKGAMQALDEGLDNVVFLRGAVEHLDEHVPPGRIAEIWIPFPDPLPKNRQARHRLTAPSFLERYRRLLAPGGAVHLKTDDAAVVTFTERAVHTMGGSVSASSDQAPGERDETAPQSTYERRYRRAGRTIYHRVFRLDGSQADAHRDHAG